MKKALKLVGTFLVLYIILDGIKVAVLYKHLQAWEGVLDLAAEAVAEDDLVEVERLHKLCDDYKWNYDRRLWTPWFLPSAWKNDWSKTLERSL